MYSNSHRANPTFPFDFREVYVVFVPRHSAGDSDGDTIRRLHLLVGWLGSDQFLKKRTGTGVEWHKAR